MKNLREKISAQEFHYDYEIGPFPLSRSTQKSIRSTRSCPQKIFTSLNFTMT